MMSVLPNGGFLWFFLSSFLSSAALDDVSATEWRPTLLPLPHPKKHAALDDVSATEWR